MFISLYSHDILFILLISKYLPMFRSTEQKYWGNHMATNSKLQNAHESICAFLIWTKFSQLFPVFRRNSCLQLSMNQWSNTYAVIQNFKNTDLKSHWHIVVWQNSYVHKRLVMQLACYVWGLQYHHVGDPTAISWVPVICNEYDQFTSS